MAKKKINKPTISKEEFLDLIDEWHTNLKSKEPLHKWLGMTPEEYKKWVEEPKEENK